VKDTDVCGNITSTGHYIFSEGNQNHIVGSLKSFGDVNIVNTIIYGKDITTSNLNAYKVTIDKASRVYSPHLAVRSFLRPSIENVLICGKIDSVEPTVITTQNFCGYQEPECRYSNQLSTMCPLTEAPPSCEIIPPLEKDFDLMVTPSNQMTLMCGETLPKFNIITTNLGQAVSTQVNISLSHPSLFSLQMLEGKSQLSPNTYISTNDGRLTLKVVPKDIEHINFDERYTLTFSLDVDATKTQTVQFMFTPYQFEAYSSSSNHGINSINVIAGKQQNIHTRLLACTSNNKAIIATNYNGKPNIKHSIIKPYNGNDGDFFYTSEFKSGISSNNLLIQESGLFGVKMSDTFKCTGFKACPENGQVEIEGYFEVKSRPWTLAICPNSHPLESGTSTSGAGFIAAGEQFSLSIKPVIWQKGGHLTQEVNTASLCDIPITHNFMLDDAPMTNLVLTSEQTTPVRTANQTKTLLESLDSLRKTHTQHKKSEYHFKHLYWSEVGSLKVKINLDRRYLGMYVNQGYRDIGRFYPKYFKAMSARWTYPNQQNFIYMNQPFDKICYNIVALNAQKENIINYAYFHNNLREKFYLGELGDYADRFIPPAPNNIVWNNNQGASVGTFMIKKENLNPTCENSACFKKDHTDGNYPDGPFNSGLKSQKSKIGLVYLDVIDEINFFSNQHIFASQPDIRFGRLNFADVSGHQGSQIRVPLLVETWKQKQFIPNTDDNTTMFNGKKHTVTALWSSSPEGNAFLSGEGIMLNGKSLQLSANQIKPIREQVMFHLNLDPNGNDLPWLKYDWDKLTLEEENPSSVVTFGVHRGNDRIIYRGEPGMIEDN
ncbi:DUF6701 domain-containing protein, partial [Vibrio sagamiensis]